MVEAGNTSETSVNFYPTTLSINPEDNHHPLEGSTSSGLLANLTEINMIL
jgi:hypothetical protein